MSAAAADIAAAIRQRLPDVGAKQLHKLLYLAQGHHLADLDEPLFDETISAWDMGPVVGRLWKAEQGGNVTGDPAGLDGVQLNTVGYVVSRYGRLSGKDLEILSHHQDPWLRADEHREPTGTARIETEWIAEWFVAARDDERPPTPPWLTGAEARRAGRARSDDPARLHALAQG